MTIPNELVKDLFNYLKPFCSAIYLGGSRVKEWIDDPHDIDLIFFSDKPNKWVIIRKRLDTYIKNHKLDELLDFIQIRNEENEEHAYGSYVNKLMIKLIGKDIKFNFDIIDKNREEYIKILKETSNQLQTGKIKNQKRWYQLLEGYCIMKNKSYDLKGNERSYVNILHDMNPLQEEARQKIIERLIKDIEEL